MWQWPFLMSFSSQHAKALLWMIRKWISLKFWCALTRFWTLLSRLRTRLTYNRTSESFVEMRNLHNLCIVLNLRIIGQVQSKKPMMINVQTNIYLYVFWQKWNNWQSKQKGEYENVCNLGRLFERLRQVYHLLHLTLLITNLNFNSSVKLYIKLVNIIHILLTWANEFMFGCSAMFA